MVIQRELERVIYVLYSQIGFIIPIVFNKIEYVLNYRYYEIKMKIKSWQHPFTRI